MKCSTCGDQMLPLFTTYYCNTCDPRPTFISASAKVKEWRKWSRPSLGTFLYQILVKGDIIPKDAVSGWHNRRRTTYRVDTDEDIMERTAAEISGGPYAKTLGWLLYESGIRLGFEISEDTLLSYDNAVLVVTKKL